MSPRRDGGPDRSPQLTVVSVIFGGAGVLALIVALVATQAAVAVFGVIALVIAAAVYGAQRVRERSAIEAEQTLGAGPLMSPMEREQPRHTPPDPMRDSSDDGPSADWDAEPEPEEPEPTISDEDDGTGARPGQQAAANVGAATATDLDVDPRTGRPFAESSAEDDDEAQPAGPGHVDRSARDSGWNADDSDDAELLGEPTRDEQAERSTEARSSDGAG